jgi:hypothetical protein
VTSSDPVSTVLTLGQISTRLGVPEHRAKYAVARFNIRPAGRVGIIRVWNETDLPRIRRALAEIATRRTTSVVSEGTACPRD